MAEKAGVSHRPIHSVSHRPIHTDRWVYCPLPQKEVGLTGFTINEKKDFDECTKCEYYGGIFISVGAVMCKYPPLTAEIVENAS